MFTPTEHGTDKVCEHVEHSDHCSEQNKTIGAVEPVRRAAVSYSKLLKERGLRVEIAGDRLILFPAELVTPDIVELVKQHKPEIITEIRKKWRI